MKNLLSFAESDSVAAAAERTVLTCSAFGVRVGVDAPCALLDRVPQPLVAGGSTEYGGEADVLFTLSKMTGNGGASAYQVAGSDGTSVVETSLEQAVEQLKRRAEEFVAETATEYVFVHAGAVAWEGKAILIPGRTFSGKSTLVMALVRAGATYLSDEYAAIDRAGRVHPFARKPRLRGTGERSDGRLELTFVNSRAFAESQATEKPLPVALVLKTAYRPDASWQPRSLTEGETLLTLLENTVAVRSQIELTIQVLKQLMLSAKGMKSARPEAEAIAGQILQSVRRTAPSSERD